MQAPTTITIPGQVGESILLVGIYFLVLFTAEGIYSLSKNASQRFVTLIENSVDSDNKVLQIYQDAAKYPDAKPLGLSVNERTGIEFSYSFFLYVKSSTFSGEDVYKHVFHKGYRRPWPLMGPAVFINGATNTMRIVMNTYKSPFTYMDITNIPVEKWFHVVINAYKGGLDVYVNGYLAQRHTFLDTIPYQNYGDIYLFLTDNYSMSSTMTPNLPTNFNIRGSYSGYLSKFVYARYALSTVEIKSLLSNGPSTQFEKKEMYQPPYLADQWWATQ